MKKSFFGRAAAAVLAISLLGGIIGTGAFAETPKDDAETPIVLTNGLTADPPPKVDVAPALRANGPWNDQPTYDYNEKYDMFLTDTKDTNTLTVEVDPWTIENLEKKLDSDADPADTGTSAALDGMPAGLFVEQTNKAYFGVQIPKPADPSGATHVEIYGKKYILSKGAAEENGGGTDTMTDVLIHYLPFAQYTNGKWSAVPSKTYTLDLKWHKDDAVIAVSTAKVVVKNKTAPKEAVTVAARPNDGNAFNYDAVFNTKGADTENITIAAKDLTHNANKAAMIANFRDNTYNYLTYGFTVAPTTADVDGFKVSCTTSGGALSTFNWKEVNKSKQKSGDDLPYAGSLDPIDFPSDQTLFIRETGVGDVVNGKYYQYIPVAKRLDTTPVADWTAMPAAKYTFTFKWYKAGKMVGTSTVTANVEAGPVSATDIKVAGATKTVDTFKNASLNLDNIFNPAVVPANATVKDVVWSVKSAGSTSAAMATGSANVLTVGTAAGDITLTATVTNLDGSIVTKDVALTTVFKSGDITIRVEGEIGDFVSGLSLYAYPATTGVTIGNASIESNQINDAATITRYEYNNFKGFSYGLITVTAYNHKTKGSATKSVTGTINFNANNTTLTLKFPETPVIAEKPTVSAPATGSNADIKVPAVEGGEAIKPAAGEENKLKDDTGTPIDTSDATKIKVTPSVDVQDVPEDNVEGDSTEKILNALPSEQEPVAVLDIKVELEVTKSGLASTHAVSETPKPLKFTIKLPAALAGEKYFKVWRHHVNEDNVEETRALPTTRDITNNTITFSSDKFSTFMIVKDAAPAPAPTPSYSHSSSGSVSSSYGTITVPDTVAGGKINEVDRTTFEFKPDPGYTVGDILVDGKSVGKGLKYRFTDGKDHKLTVIFVKIDGKTPPSTNVPQTGVVELLPLF